MSDNPYEASQVETPPRSVIRPRGYSWVMNAVAAVFIVGTLLCLLIPTYRSAPRDTAGIVHCGNNLRNIAQALKSYHAEHQAFPPAYTTDADGKPLHSWRTLLLPHLGENTLYASIDLSKPWDDPVNAKAFASRVSIYECRWISRHSKAENLTPYLASVGPNAAIDPVRSRKLPEIKDALSETLLVIEVPIDNAVPWMSPQDADEAMIVGIGHHAPLSHPVANSIAAVFADGKATPLPANLSAEQRRAMITIDGGEKVEIKSP